MTETLALQYGNLNYAGAIAAARVQGGTRSRGRQRTKRRENKRTSTKQEQTEDSFRTVKNP